MTWKCECCEEFFHDNTDPAGEFHDEGFVCEGCAESVDGLDRCILCEKYFIIGEDGNELGFCASCQEDKDFPYDLDAYYKDHDTGKVAFKGFETMERGLLERYRK